MKTDSLFYKLFRRWPELALDLAHVETPAASNYVFRSEEIKETAFRLDGVLAPPGNGDDPWVFVEVQFHPDDTLYRRLFAEIFLFLHRCELPRPWRALILYPNANVERIPVGYASLLELPEIRRVDLRALSEQDRTTPGWELLRMLIEEPRAAIDRARRLLSEEMTATSAGKSGPKELLDFIETILVYKLPRSSREEIQTMLGVTDIDLKETRFYQEVHAEGRQEGRQEGRRQGRLEGQEEGRQKEAAQLLRRLLTRRFGPLPDWADSQLTGAPTDRLELWADRILDADSLETVFLS